VIIGMAAALHGCTPDERQISETFPAFVALCGKTLHDGGMRRGVRLAIDWGDTRIGIAASDPTVSWLSSESRPSWRTRDHRVGGTRAEYEPIEVLVGCHSV
jgi:hypothetical protein